MEEILIGLLVGDAALGSFIGTNVFPIRAPQAMASPRYVTVQRISGERDYSTTGPSGLVTSRVQVDVYGDSYRVAKLAARAAVSVLSGRRGGAIKAIFVDGERDLPASDAGDVTPLFRVSIDFIIHHSEP